MVPLEALCVVATALSEQMRNKSASQTAKENQSRDRVAKLLEQSLHSRRPIKSKRLKRQASFEDSLVDVACDLGLLSEGGTVEETDKRGAAGYGKRGDDAVVWVWVGGWIE